MTGDAKAVSIRSVAQRVGVTPPSIYPHFADKEALLDARCARYFEKLHVQMQRAAVGRPSAIEIPGPGHAYIRFAVANPELYRIATMGEGRPGSDIDTVLGSAFGYLRGSVQALMDQGIYAPGDPTTITLELWSAVHGIAALLICKPHLPFGDVEAFTDRVLRARCCGQIVIGASASTPPAGDNRLAVSNRGGVVVSGPRNSDGCPIRSSRGSGR